jgi:hypothetical protein
MTVRFWGGHRESDWNSYWRFGELLRLKQQLEARAELWGIAEADICPAFRPPAPFVGHDFEVYVPNAATADAELICDEIRALTGRLAQPVPVDTAFDALVAERLLYRRQYFEPWDEALPRFILGVDFNSGRHTRLRPVEPEKWRLVDLEAGGLYSERHVLPAMVLEPSEKGARLLAELKAKLDDWYKGGFRGRPPLREVMKYQRILETYGVDCDASYINGLDDGWFPIDILEEGDWAAARELCATPLPDQAGDLLRDEQNQPVKKYGAIFFFVALTDH